MNDSNKRKLQYFENASMKGLYADMEDRQSANQKRLMSPSIQKDGGAVEAVMGLRGVVSSL